MSGQQPTMNAQEAREMKKMADAMGGMMGGMINQFNLTEPQVMACQSCNHSGPSILKKK